MSRSAGTLARLIAAGTAVAVLTLGFGIAPASPASAASKSAKTTAKQSTAKKSTKKKAAKKPAKKAAKKKTVVLHPAGGVIKPTKRISAVDVLAKRRGRGGVTRVLAAMPVVGVSSSSALAAGGLIPARVGAAGSVGSAGAADLRDDTNQQGTTLIPAVGNQGSIGSCLPWTVAYTLMGYYARRDGASGAPFAPLYLYMMNTTKAPTAGTNPEQVLSYAKNYGVDTQDDYYQGYYDYKVKPTTAQKANAANFKVTSWTTLWSGGNSLGSTGAAARRALVESSLDAGDPVIIGFDVYTSFDAINSSTLYTTDSGMYRGGHMVTVVAYDSQGVTLRNQWGTGWGDHGDARVSWSWLGNKTFGAYTISGVTTPAKDSEQANPKATILKLSATKGSAEGGTPVSITGANLATTSKVNFGSASATPSSVSTVNGVTTVTVNSPVGTIGVQDVTVTNSGGTGAANSKARFTYTPVPPKPAQTPLSTSTAVTEGGSSVTVNGVFLDKASVVVGRTTVSPRDVTAMSNTAITFKAPPHLAGDVAVSVRNRGGVAAFGTLTYVPGNPPVIGSLSASSVSILWTNQVTVTGSALAQVRKAVVAGKTVSFTKVSDTELVLKLPRMSAAVSGNVVLSSQWSTSAATQASAFNWIVPGKPAVGEVTGIVANTVGTATLSGTRLQAVTKISLTGPGGKKYYGSRIVIAADGESLTFTVPRLAVGDYTVTVTSPAGTSGVGEFGVA